MMEGSSRNFGNAIAFIFNGTGRVLGSAADHFMGPSVGNTFRASGKIAGAVFGTVGGASAAGVSTLARTARTRKMQRSVDLIEAAAEAEDYDRLLPLARDFARRNPQDPEGQVWQAFALSGMGRHEEALAATDRAVALGLDESEAHFMRAEIYDRNGNAGKAIQAYTLAARNPENRAASLLFRARLLQKIGDLEQALGDANEAVAALPDEAAYSVRGHIYRDRGELDKCIDDYGRAIQLRPNPVFFENRAEVYEMLGKFDKAQEDRSAAEAASREVSESQQGSGGNSDPSRGNAIRNMDSTHRSNTAPVVSMIAAALLMAIGFITGIAALTSIGFLALLGGLIWYAYVNPKNKELRYSPSASISDVGSPDRDE